MPLTVLKPDDLLCPNNVYGQDPLIGACPCALKYMHKGPCKGDSEHIKLLHQRERDLYEMSQLLPGGELKAHDRHGLQAVWTYPGSPRGFSISRLSVCWVLFRWNDSRTETHYRSGFTEKTLAHLYSDIVPKDSDWRPPMGNV